MRVLIASDTHGRDKNLLKVTEQEKNIDFMVHLGDIGRLEEYIEEVTGLACFAVRGNNDYGSLLPDENIIMLGKHRTFITHGHQYGVNYTVNDLVRHAKALDCDIALYGHTHYPEVDEISGVTVVNPGSLTYPRQPGHEYSYVIANIDEESGNVTFEIKYLD